MLFPHTQCNNQALKKTWQSTPINSIHKYIYIYLQRMEQLTKIKIHDNQPVSI